MRTYLGTLEGLSSRHSTPPRVRAGAQAWRTPDGEVWAESEVRDGERCLTLPGIGRFVLDRELRVWGWPESGASFGSLRQAFLAEALPMLHQANGGLCLHASAVALPGGGPAIGFLGPREAGKSTLSQALVQRGARPLADDLLVLYREDDDFLVQPLPHTRRLRPPSMRFFAVPARCERRAAPPGDPLAALFLVEPNQAPAAIDRIPEASALFSILEQAVCFLLDAPAARSEFFEAHTALVSRVPCWRLRHPHAFEELPNTLDAVEATLRNTI